MFRIIAWAAHCLPTQFGYFDPAVVELMKQELRNKPLKTDNVVELKVEQVETVTRKAA